MERLSKAKLKLFASLKLKKFREQHQEFLLEGWKLVEESIREKWELSAIVIREDQIDQLESSELETYEAPLYLASGKEFDRISSQSNPEGVLAVARIRLAQSQPQTGFILDRITDPGNLGTLMRTADWFGMEGIILSEGCADPFNPKVVRSSMGAIFRMKIYQQGDLPPLMVEQGPAIAVADLSGDQPDEIEWSAIRYILLGNESRGILPSIRENSNLKKVLIPGMGKAESLNVAVSGSILAWEWSQVRKEH